jgi:uncharacterized protein YbaP (TraB family)
MNTSAIVSAIDEEIAKLQRARALLVEANITGSKVGRPARSTPAAKKSAKRVLSPEARKRIADAQKKRWAAHRRKGA